MPLWIKRLKRLCFMASLLQCSFDNVPLDITDFGAGQSMKSVHSAAADWPLVAKEAIAKLKPFQCIGRCRAVEVNDRKKADRLSGFVNPGLPKGRNRRCMRACQHDRTDTTRAEACSTCQARTPAPWKRRGALSADCLILDLEDAVAPDAKEAARGSDLGTALKEGGYELSGNDHSRERACDTLGT